MATPKRKTDQPEAPPLKRRERKKTDKPEAAVEAPPTRARAKKAIMASLTGVSTREDEQVLNRAHRAPWAKKDARLGALYKQYHPEDGMDTTAQELIYMAQVLVLCGLPYRQPKDERGKLLTHYERVAKTAGGEVRLTLTAQKADVGLPFGKDRVLLSWLITKALQNDSPVITWDTAMDFFGTFEIERGGYQYRWFLDSWKRLANLGITIQRHEYGHDEDWGSSRLLIEDYRLPSRRDRSIESTGLVRLPIGAPYAVGLSAKLFEELKAGRVVPLPLQIMREFQDEPKGWDFACYVFWRSWICEQVRLGRLKGSQVARIPWRDLMSQLGSQDKDEKRLRKTLQEILERLRSTVWPEGRARFEQGILVIEPPLGGLHLVQAID